MADFGFPDVEALATRLLEPVSPGHVGTVYPDVWDGELLVLVARVGGTDDGVFDRPLIEVSCLGPSRAVVWRMSQQARALMLSAPDNAIDGVWVDRAATSVAGQQIPELDPDDRRVTSTFAWTVRAQ